jgi:hypothetical protein
VSVRTPLITSSNNKVFSKKWQEPLKGKEQPEPLHIREEHYFVVSDSDNAIGYVKIYRFAVGFYDDLARLQYGEKIGVSW